MVDVTNKRIFLSGHMTGARNKGVGDFCDAEATLHGLVESVSGRKQ